MKLRKVSAIEIREKLEHAFHRKIAVKSLAPEITLGRA
jgi:hypothetical protein